MSTATVVPPTVVTRADFVAHAAEWIQHVTDEHASVEIVGESGQRVATLTPEAASSGSGEYTPEQLVYLRAELERVLADPRPSIPDEEVWAYMEAKFGPLHADEELDELDE